MTLIEAVDYYTGGVYSPPHYSPKWAELGKRIEESEYTPPEFCFYCVQHLMDRYDPSALMKTNLVTCDKTWKNFLAYKKNKEKEIRDRVHRQRKEYVGLKKIMTPDLILVDDRTGLNPLIRCDLACKDTSGETLERVLNRYSEEADYILIGNPEYKKHIRHYRKGE